MDTSTLKWSLIGGGLLLGTAVVVALLTVFAPAPETSDPPPQSPLVSTVPVDVRAGSLLVRGTGTVRPVREIELTAEVGGRLVDVSDALVSGGRFDAGATLARIDPADYRSAVQQAEAQVTQARVQLLQAQEEAGAAREDYERLRGRTGETPTPDSTELGRLVFNEPQVAQAQSTLESARAALQNARTNLERTRLQVPFDGMVRQKQADLGAYVAPGTPVATVYGTEAAEVVVSLPSREAALIENLWATSGQSADAGLPARVTSAYGDQTYSWEGRVHRVEGAIDQRTRTIDVVVRVPEPYNQAPTIQSRRPEAPPEPRGRTRPPLAIGTYTTVDIEGRRNGTYHVVPRRAVHTREPGQPPVVWTAVGDSMLAERTVEPIQTVEENTYLAPTLDPDARVITTDLRVQTDSMAVRVER
ncbi:efflux RND transporter periplasmic adaptor subunit [Salinibacter ruber]|uniref:RND family efflux transporter MFP subunit n=1 Tax=Salinibacter ruber TaxID=146919 RepID=A0A9X2U1U4_9BACT|nr:efflux RND transporter periplasmic adaptor subunit [Salinibacter ruber]MCS3857654.1 RND family efflux transporter MFP subunit [Salinibacter ruber]MCS3864479.1 RND family efflux transporter MFP subunit [Salinibacter ruber]MCS4150586.1 RND family efflux transporter MFP subunit [Salinibacter ruber]